MTRPPLIGRVVYARAQELAFPRYPGTEGDRRAIEIVRGWFEAAGLEVVEESFDYDVRPAFRALRLLLVGSALLVAASAIVALERPGWGLAILAAAVVAGGMLVGWAPWLEKIYRGGGPTRTANVVGLRRAKGRPRLRLVLMAHHDSKSQSLTLPVRAGFTIGAILGAAALGVLELATDFGVSPPPAALLLPALVAVVSLLALATLSSGNLSPGGVDNAGSVAIVAELAKPLALELPDDVEFVVLSPGAEEDHMVGAMRWLDLHAEEIEETPTVAINLDGAGIPGQVVVLDRYGFGQSFSRRLSKVAREMAERSGLPIRSAMLPPAMGIDAIPFAHRGIQCVSLASGSLGREVMAVHSRHDVGTNLDPRALDEAATLTIAIAVHVSGADQAW